jgi:hypothetical protein
MQAVSHQPSAETATTAISYQLSAFSQCLQTEGLK